MIHHVSQLILLEFVFFMVKDHTSNTSNKTRNSLGTELVTSFKEDPRIWRKVLRSEKKTASWLRLFGVTFLLFDVFDLFFEFEVIIWRQILKINIWLVEGFDFNFT